MRTKGLCFALLPHAPHSERPQCALKMLMPHALQAFIYAAGLQLLLSVPRVSAPAAAAGLLAGAINQLNPFGLKRVKVLS